MAPRATSALRLYGELAEWWPLLSAPADYAEEAGIYAEVIDRATGGRARTLLELGSGGGNNAGHLRSRFRLTLTDLSPEMIEVSRRANPDCEHFVGDMRGLRLARTFDAVLVHDAIMYMGSEADLRATFETARAHLAPGGVALFVPDHTQETWAPGTSQGGHDLGSRSLRYLEWAVDDDPSDGVTNSIYAILRRDGGRLLPIVVEEHRLGLFPRAVWLRGMGEAGFVPSALPYRHSSFAPEERREIFLGRVPAA